MCRMYLGSVRVRVYVCGCGCACARMGVHCACWPSLSPQPTFPAVQPGPIFDVTRQRNARRPSLGRRDVHLKKNYNQTEACCCLVCSCRECTGQKAIKSGRRGAQPEGQVRTPETLLGCCQAGTSRIMRTHDDLPGAPGAYLADPEWMGGFRA